MKPSRQGQALPPAARSAFGLPIFSFHVWLPPRYALSAGGHVTFPNCCTHEANKLHSGTVLLSGVACWPLRLLVEAFYQLSWNHSCTGFRNSKSVNIPTFFWGWKSASETAGSLSLKQLTDYLCCFMALLPGGGISPCRGLHFVQRRAKPACLQSQRLTQSKRCTDCKRLKRSEPTDLDIIRNGNQDKQLSWFQGGYLGCTIFVSTEVVLLGFPQYSYSILMNYTK